MNDLRLLTVTLGATLALSACAGSSSPPSAPATSSASAPATSSASAAPTYTAPPASLPAVHVALSTSPPPWLPPLLTDAAATPDYVAAAGLPYAQEMLTVHYHAHLDVNVNGKPVTVPQYIGFVAKGQSVVGLAPLHTHDQTGIIHIENSVPATFELGQVFIEWGVRFTPTCIGSYCSGKGNQLAVYVNGTKYAGDPTHLVLKKHQEIAVEYGPTGKLPPPPTSYSFPPGD